MTLDLATPQHSDDEARTEALVVLAQQVRDLVDAVVRTGVAESELTSVSADLVALTERLNQAQRTAPLPHEAGLGGRFRNLGNAVTGECNPHALPLVLDRPAGRGSRAEITFRLVHEGPPGSVHGGVISMILDHLLGDAVAADGKVGMTGTLSIKFRRPVPYNEPLVASAAVSRSEGRKTWAEGTITRAGGGPVLAEATGLFITPAAWAEVLEKL